MTGTEVYNLAITSLGFSDAQILRNKSLVIINQVYDELYLPEYGEYKPLTVLNDEVSLPDRIVSPIMVYGVAEKLALGEGDGELQQYFRLSYDKAKARITVVDRVKDVFGGAL